MAPEFWIEIWDAYRKGDGDRAEEAQRQAVEVLSLALLIDGRFHAIVKAVLSHRLGIDCGSPRPPALPLSADQRRQVISAAGDLGLHPVEVSA